MKPSVTWTTLAAAALMLGTAGCADRKPLDDLTMPMITDLQAKGAVLPFSQLHAAVLARHPGSEVQHAALDEIDGRFLYQADLIDHYKMEWFVEIDAKTAATITDREHNW